MFKKGTFLVVAVLFLMQGFIVSALSFSDLNQTHFNLGTYNRTFYNTTAGAVQLNATLTAGNFSSRIFDAALPVNWTSLAWTPGLCYGCELPNNGATESGFLSSVGMNGNFLLYHLNNDSGENGTYFSDFSGNNNRALCLSAVRCPTLNVSGKIGRAYRFDSIAANPDFLNATNPSQLSSIGSELTIEAWVRPDVFSGGATASFPTIIDKDPASAFSLYFNSAGRFVIDLVNSSGVLSKQTITSSSTHAVGTWYHIVFVYNGTEMRYYRNGVLDGSTPQFGPVGTNSKDLLIGAGWDGSAINYYFRGLLDEVAFYNRSLTESEITNHYQRGVGRLNLSVRSCDDSVCAGESFVDVNDSGSGSFNLSGRYFQYFAGFTTEATSVLPTLFNATVQYASPNVAPLITIVHPSAVNYSATLFEVNYTASDPDNNLASCWYSTNDGQSNSSAQNCGINFTGVSASQGTNTWTVYANDSLGFLNFSQVSFFVDSVFPLISYGAGTDSDGASAIRNSIFVNTSVTEQNFANITFTLYNQTALVNRTSFSSAVYSINWTNLPYTGYSYNVSVSDVLGNTNSTLTRTITLIAPDTGAPSVTIINPQTGLYSSGSIPFNVSLNENGTCDYTLSAGLINYSMSTLNNVDFNATRSLSDGSYLVRFYCSDLSGNLNSSESVAFSVDLNSPQISITTPQNSSYSSIQTALNYTVADTSIGSCWYSTNDGQSNSSLICGQNVSGLSSSQGTNTWTVYANDTLGRTNLSRVSFFVDSVVPQISIVSPINGSNFSFSTISVNYTVSDLAGSLSQCWWTNNGGSLNISVTCGQNFSLSVSEGLTTISVYTNDTTGNTNSSSVSFTVDTTAPAVSLSSPSSGQIFGYNTSIPLTFSVSDAGVGVSSCWFSVLNSTGKTEFGLQNTTLSDCDSTSFSVSSTQSYTLLLYANDTLGNLNTTSRAFSVNLEAPGIELLTPEDGSALFNTSVIFRYNATDVELDSCELWGNFNGTLARNQTNSTSKGLVSSAVSIFVLNLSESSYQWYISCNDTHGNTAPSGTRAFAIDRTKPQITISEPTGTYERSSVPPTGIPLSYSISDSTATQCAYNITLSDGTPVTSTPNRPIDSCTNTTLTVGGASIGVPTSYILYLSSTDLAGNSNFTSKAFTISVPIPSSGGDSGSSGGSSGGGGGGGGGSISGSGLIGPAVVSIESVPPLRVRPGDSAEFPIEVRNRGNKFLNRCVLTMGSPANDWVDSDKTLSLSSGEVEIFPITLSIPREVKPNTYSVEMKVSCSETNITKSVDVVVIKSNLELTFLNYSRPSVDVLLVYYTLREFTGVDQEVLVSYELSNQQDLLLVNGSSLVSLRRDSTRTIPLEIPLPKDSFGQLTLHLAAESSDTLSELDRELVLSSQGISGFAISGDNARTLRSFALYVLLAIGAIILFRIGLIRYRRSQPLHDYPNVVPEGYHPGSEDGNFLKNLLNFRHW